MTTRPDSKRRALMVAATGAAALLATPGALAEAVRNRFSMTRRTFPIKPDPVDAERMIQRAVRGREPVDGLVLLNLGGIAENGDSVPLEFDIACSMSGNDYPEKVHIFVKHNPFPEVARYHFGPWNGSAKTEMRMRMRQSSEVVLVAEMADGRVSVKRQAVEVLAGACG